MLELNDPAAPCMIDFTYCQGSRLFGLSLVGRDLGQGVHGILTRPHDTNEDPDRRKREDFPAIERCMVRGFTGNGLDMDVWCLSLRSCAIGYNAPIGRLPVMTACSRERLRNDEGAACRVLSSR